MAVLLPLPTLAALATWLVLVSTTRYVSLASLCAAAMLCGLRLGLTPGPLAPEHRVLSLFCLWAVALVFVRHRTNVARLLAGTENRLRDSPAMFNLTRTLHVLAVGDPGRTHGAMDVSPLRSESSCPTIGLRRIDLGVTPPCSKRSCLV